MQNAKLWILFAVIVLLIAITAISDWRKPADKNPQTSSSSVTIDIQSGTKQEKEEANVTVLIEYLKDKSDSKTMTFAVSLDTHSVNLDSFDFGKDIILEKDGKSTAPSKVTASGVGHHRLAEVTFEKTSPPFTMVLKNLASINRREFLFEKLQ